MIHYWQYITHCRFLGPKHLKKGKLHFFRSIGFIHNGGFERGAGMEIIRKIIYTHRGLSCAAVLGFIVFVNCWGFPVYNLNRAWSFPIMFEYIWVMGFSAVYIGGGLAELFPKKTYIFAVSLMAALTFVGIGLRFLIEFGEVSNTYNYTLPNIILHFGTFIALSSLSWLYAMKRWPSKTEVSSLEDRGSAHI